MKPISQIRRENLQELVNEAGSQVSVAVSIEKDKNQVYQWLLPDGAKGARNIGAKSARALEAANGKPLGWMDLDREGAPPPSQPVGIDTEKLADLIETLEGAIMDARRPIPARLKARLLTRLYVEPELNAQKINAIVAGALLSLEDA